ncbi:MAG: MATE family efflux transporter [bacterium]|nr:MATE family efflux transporter [bacterium]
MQSREELLGNEKINKLMMQMAIPSVIAQIINILYSIIDRMYIGHIPHVGTDSLTGIGLTFPIITFISAFSAFVGTGGAPLSAIALGKGDRDHAEKILGNGVFLLTAFTVVLMGFFYAFQKPLLYMFGASDATYPYASTYISIYLIGTLFVLISLGLNPYIISQGQPRIAMFSVLIGAIVNIVLDPIFIFGFGWGVKGAALATIISQAISAIWVISFLVGKKSTLKIKLPQIKPHGRTLKSICALGVSPFVMRSTESLISIVLNRGLQMYGGDLYVGSLTVLQSVMQLISAPISGFTQGVQPIISYNYGAAKFDRVRETYRKMISICFVFSFVATLSTILFPELFAAMFTNDAALIALVNEKMPIFMFGMLLFGLQMGVQPTFISLGQAKVSLFIALLRKVILLVPFALILPCFLGVQGVYIAEPISDITSAVVATSLFVFHIKKILNEESLNRVA